MCSAAFPGLSTLKTDTVLIFDLDDTILSTNSFRHWVRYMLTGYFGGMNIKNRLLLSMLTGQILMERKLLRRHSHYHTKRQLQALWAPALEKDSSQAALHNLNASLRTYVRQNLLGIISEVAKGHIDAVLATAAAGEYAQELGKTLGFKHILTTPLATESEGFENHGVRKCVCVLAMLDKQGWNSRRRIFFTDHEDDLPLIRQCEYTLWFGGDEELASVQKRAPQTEIIACSNMPEANIMRLLMQLCPASYDKSPAALQYG